MSKLTPDMLADDEQLALAIDEFLGSDRSYRRRRRKIVELQGQLRELVGDEAWALVLEVEESVNRRNADLLTRAVRWAFEQGRRRGRR